VKDGCLILHGLTGTPDTVSSFRRVFLDAGFNISAPCLAGHGESIEELSKVKWQDWYNSVRIAYSTLKRDSHRIFCAGTSLGALLSLKLAIVGGWGVRAISVIGTPLRLSRLESVALTIVRYSPLRFMIKSIPKDLTKSVADPEGRKRYELMSLPRLPVHAVHELTKLQCEVAKGLQKISHPLLVMHGREDKVAPLFNADILRNSVSSKIVESVILNGCKHVLTMDYERVRVAKTALYFFKRFA